MPGRSVWKTVITSVGLAAALACITWGAWLLGLNLSAAGSVYFLCVVLIALKFGFGQGTLVSVLAVNLLNYFFVPPVYSFRVVDPQNWMALAMFEITAVIVSRLSARMKAQSDAETCLRRRSDKLYELSRRVLMVDPSSEPGAQVVQLIDQVYHSRGVALFDAASAKLDSTGQDAAEMRQLARTAFLQDQDQDEATTATFTRIMKLGSGSIGALAMRAVELDPFSAGAIGPLATTALERARSFEQESLARAERESEQLRATVLDALAHAFKTPLTAIRTASSGLLETGTLLRGDLDMVTLIDQEAARLDQLASRVLQMARMDAADLTLFHEQVSLAGLLDGILSDSRLGLDVSRIDTVRPASGPVVHADREMLKLAIIQYLDNAQKYSDPGSRILVRVQASGVDGVLSVQSHGRVVNPADRERIFERFYRAQDSKPLARGTGLGLSIVKKTMEAHGGRVWVTSDERQGTTFFMALPKAAGEK